MEHLRQLMGEITRLTLELETNYPELYKTLEETPLFPHTTGPQAVRLSDLKNYLETLKRILQEHLETHQIKQAGKQ